MLSESVDVEDALRRAVNHSGDSDSTGSLVGNLLGVVHGEGAIPARWLASLDGRDVVATVADDLATARAGEVPSTWRYEQVGPKQVVSVNTDDDAAEAWLDRYPAY